MSARTTTQVSSVSGATLGACAVGGALLAAGIIALVGRALSAGAKAAFEQSTRALPTATDAAVKSAAALRIEQRTIQQDVQRSLATSNLSDVEAAKVTALASAASAPYLVADTNALHSTLKTLETAGSVVEVQRAEEQLRRVLEAQHHQVFVESLTVACERATLAAGFQTVEVARGIGDTVRVVGSNPAGHALVTEIDINPRHEPTIETEVVGVTDGRCNSILDKFEAALAEAGVRGTPPKRRFTGGVCELSAAKEFLRRKARRNTAQKKAEATEDTPQSEEEARRRGRLNAQNKQRQH